MMIVARSTPSPSSPAPSARRDAASGLDRSAWPRRSDTRAANAQSQPLLQRHLDMSQVNMKTLQYQPR
jgi:hypothetical protein